MRRGAGRNRRTNEAAEGAPGVGERAARDVLDLARKGRAFATLDTLIRRQGNRAVQSGAALALAATMQASSDLAGEPVDQITHTVFTAE